MAKLVVQGACGYQTIGALFFAAAFLQGLMSSTPLWRKKGHLGIAMDFTAFPASILKYKPLS